MTRKYIRNEERLRANQGCLTDCIAYILNIHPRNVPLFVFPRIGWNDRMKKYLRKHGYLSRWSLIKFAPLKKTGLQIVCGNSLKWKTAAHVVVYKGKKLVYDPQYPSLWKDSRITHRLIITKI